MVTSESEKSDIEFTPKSRKDFKEKKKNLKKKKEKKNDVKGMYSKDKIKSRVFHSDVEIENFMKEFSEATKETYYIRDSKDKSRIGDVLRREANSKIKNCFIKYLCCHGPSRLSTSAGLRKVYTSKLDCSGEISFKLDESGTKYVISQIVDHEGHEVLNNCQNLLVANRKLSEDQKALVKDTVKMKGSTLKLMSTLYEQGKTPVLRDISNMKYQIKQEGSLNCLSSVIETLKRNDALYEIKCDEDNAFEAVYFYVSHMKYTFQAWPECIMIDSTYKILQLEYPVVVVAIIDGNGSTQIVGMCILVRESEEIFQWFIDNFKKHNEISCSQLKGCMTDKDLVARKVIKQTFNIPVYICIWHTMQVFKRTITTDQMKINKKQREESLQLLQRLVYSTSDEQYHVLYNEFVQSAPKPVVHYFNSNWHDVRKEWVKCYMTEGTCGTFTNNRIESFNQKLKLFCSTSNYLSDFISDFFPFLNILLNERDKQIVDRLSKQPTFHMEEHEKLYYEYLTPFAFEYVCKAMKDSVYIKNFEKIGENDVYNIKSVSGIVKYQTSISQCSCVDYYSMGLPCRHIFKVRCLEKVNIFDEHLCNSRWTLTYLRKHHRLFRHVTSTNNNDKQHSEINNIVETLHSPIDDTEECAVSSEENRNIENEIVSSSKSTVLVQQSHDCNNTIINNIVETLHPPIDATEECVITSEENHSIQNEIVPSSNSTVSVQQTHDCNNTLDVRNIKLIPNIAKKGRRKGKNLNAIGLPKKSRLLCQKFDSMSEQQKVQIMLSWIINEDELKQKRLGQDIIELDDLNCTETLPCWFYNEGVPLSILKPFVTNQVYTFICVTIQDKDKCTWICKICQDELGSSSSIQCDRCWTWMHFKCIKLKKCPAENDPYFCNVCLKNCKQ